MAGRPARGCAVAEVLDRVLASSTLLALRCTLPGTALLEKSTSFLGDVYAWFWRHEHRCVVMGDHLGIKARCIGHGAMPTKVPFGPPLFPDVPIVTVDERNLPSPETGAIHGFALLPFAGPEIGVSYIDEFGGVFFTEQFTQ